MSMVVFLLTSELSIRCFSFPCICLAEELCISAIHNMERESLHWSHDMLVYKGSCCVVLMGSSDTKSCIFPIIWQIRVIERNCEIPHEGPFCDLMWSDPEDIETWAVSPRGAGWLFGSRVTSEVMNLTSNRNMSHSLETNVMSI